MNASQRVIAALLLSTLHICALCACAPKTPPLASPAIPPQTHASPSPTAAPSPTPYDCINESGDTIATRFLPPEEYARKEADGYGEFIRREPLLPDGSPILLHNGEPGSVQNWHAAVLAIDVGERDLQQCADAALRLRCEYLYSIGEYEKINYHLTNGDEFPYGKYREGYRLKVDGNTTDMVKSAQPDESYEAFRAYLDVLFNYASTRSLYPESERIAFKNIQIGDLFLFAGSPGHCIIVMDVCENEKGEKAILLGQSSMPAQQIHILKPPSAETPWLFINSIQLPLRIMGWEFTEENIRRMP